MSDMVETNEDWVQIGRPDADARPFVGERITMVVPKDGVMIGPADTAYRKDQVQTRQGTVTRVDEDGTYSVLWDAPKAGEST